MKETTNEPKIKENSNQMYLDCLPMLCHFYLKTSVKNQNQSMIYIHIFQQKINQIVKKNARIEHFDR